MILNYEFIIDFSMPRTMQGSKPWRYTGEEANMDREDIKMLMKK